MCRFAAILAALACCFGGCRSAPAPRTSAGQSESVVAAHPKSVSDPPPSQQSEARNPPVKLVALQKPPSEPEVLPTPTVQETGLDEELGLQEFVAEVVARHPSVQSMAAAWQAAAQRYPQVVALDDPMFMVMAAPDSFNAPQVQSGYTLEMREKLPWFGKRALRGDAANEEASAAAHDVQDARLKIALMAQLAYIDYYLADQQLQVNDETRSLLGQFREIAQVRYQTNLVTQQDVLQTDVELAEVDRRRIELERTRKVAIARMNTLLLRAPNLPMPKPTLKVAGAEAISESELLLAWALENRPDLAAQAHRVSVEAANLELAHKQFLPDADVFGRYDSFWLEKELRGQVGVSVNLPVYRRKLNAAVYEAQFRLQRERAEYDQLVAEIGLEVQTGVEQLRESQQTVALYKKRLLPAAEQYLAAARSNYEVGKATSLDFVQAQRQLVMAREKQIEASAMLAQRIVELERNCGGSLPLEPH